MDITTRISSKPAPAAGHHNECEREHVPNLITFTSSFGPKGFGQTKATDCMFYEMEDAAYESIMDAVETGRDNYDSADDESVRDAAAVLAERADALSSGARTHVRSRVVAA